MCTLSVLRRPIAVVDNDDDEPPLLARHLQSRRAAHASACTSSRSTHLRRSRSPSIRSIHSAAARGSRCRPPDSCSRCSTATPTATAVTRAREEPRPHHSSTPERGHARRRDDARPGDRSHVQFLSFRLVIVGDDGAREAVSDGRQLDCRDVHEGEAWMRSSSSVRPEVVLPHRGAMFQHDVAPSRSAAAQDRFHLTRHRRIRRLEC